MYNVRKHVDENSSAVDNSMFHCNKSFTKERKLTSMRR